MVQRTLSSLAGIRTGWLGLTVVMVLWSGTSACQFPFRSNSTWTKLHPSSKITYRFTGTSFTETTCNGNNCLVYKVICKEAYQNGVYYVEIHPLNPGIATVYSCINFLHHTGSVFQIQKSEDMIFKYDSVCGLKKLHLQNEIVISDDAPNAKTTECPFAGGHFMDIEDSVSNPICHGAVIQPRLESGCSSPSSMVFDFLRTECVDERLAMSPLQNVKCVQTWVYRHYRYILLRRSNGPPLHWCMRLNDTAPNDGIAWLYMAQQCPVGKKTKDYLKLDLYPVPKMDNVCRDPYGICEDERVCDDTRMSRFCARKCGLCDPSHSACTFPIALQGRWHGGDNKVVMTVDSNSVTFPGNETFTCYTGTGYRYVVTRWLDGGCFPQFLCLDIRKLYPSSMEYFVSDIPRWLPLNFSNLVEDVCDGDQNTIDSDVNVISYDVVQDPTLAPTLKKYTILVHKEESSRFVSCWIKDWSPKRFRTWHEEKMLNNNTCSTCLTYDQDVKPEAFSDTKFNCDGMKYNASDGETFANNKTEEKLNFCVGLFSDNGGDNTRVVLTQSPAIADGYQCWVFMDHVTNETSQPLSVTVYDLSTYNTIRASGLSSETKPLRTMSVSEDATYGECPQTELLLSSSVASYYSGWHACLIALFLCFSYLLHSNTTPY